MKKVIALLLACVLAFAMVACGGGADKPDVKGEGVMTYAEYAAAALDTEVTIECYLTGADTEVYKAAEALAIGDVIDMEGFLYWYDGPNPHITKITKVQ